MITRKKRKTPHYKSLYYEQLSIKNAQLKEIARLREVISKRGTQLPPVELPRAFDLSAILAVLRLIVKMLETVTEAKEVNL